MAKTLKISGIILLILTLLGCTSIIGWYLYIEFYAPDKVVSNTFEVGLQTLADGSQTKYFVEVDYKANENGDGLAVLDVKFNYMLDEKQEAFYSQGLQYTSREGIGFDSANEWKYKEGGEFKPFPVYYNYHRNETTYFPSSKVNRYNYASGDDYKTTITSTNPISDDTHFKIQLGDDLYLMKFKGGLNQAYDEKQSGFMFDVVIDKYYYNVNADFFCNLLWTGIQSIPNGTNSAMVWEFGDYFDYYEDQDRDGKYDLITDESKIDKIKADTKSYYSILVKKSSVGVKKASESVFNCVNGSPNYNTTNTIIDDYFIGRTVFNCTFNQFDLVQVLENNYALKLRQDFIEHFTQPKYEGKVYLSILIELDILGAENKTFVGFTKDSGLDKFTVVSCQTVETINGNPVYSEVAYD